MSDYAIQINRLGKKFKIGEVQRSYSTLRETVSDAWRRRWKSQGRRETTFWALKDVSLEVKHGDVVGLIGRNGAGKSTLLKVLSKITEPTEGYVDLYGTVGTLLEVGTGFHPELTGRENVFLNGALLGMSRADIRGHFDEIVAFAEVERFLDTPVKHYSTGMYLRLAFAVAAHLDPEIMLVDEVLAVGDIAFQKKCLGKMGDVAKQGRTIIFVSHNMGAVRSLCNRGIVLDGGTVHSAGDISSSIESYYRLAAQADEAPTDAPTTGFGFGPLKLVGHEGSTIQQSEPFEISTTLHFASPVTGFSLFCIFEDMNQHGVFHSRRESSDIQKVHEWRGSYHLNVQLPVLWLEPGLYTLYFKVLLWNAGEPQRHMSNRFHLDVGGESNGHASILCPPKDWRITAVTEEQPAGAMANVGR